MSIEPTKYRLEPSSTFLSVSPDSSIKTSILFLRYLLLPTTLRKGQKSRPDPIPPENGVCPHFFRFTAASVFSMFFSCNRLASLHSFVKVKNQDLTPSPTAPRKKIPKRRPGRSHSPLFFQPPPPVQGTGRTPRWL